MKRDEMVLIGSVKCIPQEVTRVLYVGKDGVEYISESAARWSLCTHTHCEECRKPTSKVYTLCESCRESKAMDKWKGYPKVEYTGQPVVIFNSDTYLWEDQDIIDFCESEDVRPEDLFLVEAHRIMPHPLHPSDVYADFVDEDYEWPQNICDQFASLSKLVHKEARFLYYPSSIAIDSTSLQQLSVIIG